MLVKILKNYFDYISQDVPDIHEKPWTKMAMCSHAGMYYPELIMAEIEQQWDRWFNNLQQQADVQED